MENESDYRLVPVGDDLEDGEVDEEFREAEEYALSAKAESTRKSYDSAWNEFEKETKAKGKRSLPADPTTVALYVKKMAVGGRQTQQ